MCNYPRPILTIFLFLTTTFLSANVYTPITSNAHYNGIEREIYFYHSDHLGSASWITDSHCAPIQYLHYLPYGEIIANQNPSSIYNERFKFTGKELDEESGYYYFGARYYWSTLGYFISSDPLSDKTPGISSYAYCGWNPVNRLDPDGRWFETAWDLFNLGLDIHSLHEDIQNRNLGDAIVDAASLILDAGAVLLPFVPGGAGTALKVYRAADKIGDAANISKQGQKAKEIGSYIKPNGGNAKPHGGQKHNSAIDKYIEDMPAKAKNIRKNQAQVDINGNKVGTNRPDVQYDLNGQHYNVEFDTHPENGLKHQQTVQANDPNAKVILKTVE